MSLPNLITQGIDEAYSRCPNLRDLLESFLKMAFEVTQTETGTIFLPDDLDRLRDSKIVIENTRGSHRENVEIIEETSRTAYTSISKRIVQTKKPYLCNDIENDPCYLPLTSAFKANLGVPILYQEQVKGVIVVESSERGHFNEAHQAALEELAHHLSVLIKRIQLAQWTKYNGYELRLIGKSEPIKRIDCLVEKFAPADCPILITGETGTGKELIGYAIHFNSLRKDKSFVVVNCGAFTSDDLLASELFGHVEGAFTDAKYEKKGKFELADGGTIFLDEVSCMRPMMQAALLRVLRYGEIQKLGDEKTRRRVNVRTIAASNQDLKKLIEEGYFREDLYSRLRVVEIKAPPLRERREDIPFLAEYFLNKYSKKVNLPCKSISNEAMQALIAYHWPDNVAGLENATHFALLISEQEIRLADLPEEIREASQIPKISSQGLDDSKGSFVSLVNKMKNCERDYMLKALQANNWNISKTARILEITRQALQRKIRKHDLRASQLSNRLQ